MRGSWKWKCVDFKESHIHVRQLTLPPSSNVSKHDIRCTDNPYFPPSFERLHNIIYPRSVTEFVYRYNSANRAHVFLSFILQTNDRAHEVADVLGRLAKEDMQGMDISDDELAKAHGRYLVGGRADVDHERVFRFGTCINAGA